MQPLTDRIAVVAGATRGAGRGIARMLGEAGATVYSTGRSSRTAKNTSRHHYAGRPETIEETAEMVDAAGGVGIPVRVDHTSESEVAALFRRIRDEQAGRLDLLVNVLTGPPAQGATPFWQLPAEDVCRTVHEWLWPHLVTSRYAAEMMVERGSGLVVEIVEQETIAYHGQLSLDLVEIALKRLAFAMAEDLAPKGVAALAVTPGFMRTEAILDHFGTTETAWREAAERNPEARGFGFAGSETPCFVGRAVAALAADPNVMEKSGGLFSSWELSDEYGFSDIDGGRPHWGRYFAANYPELANAQPKCGWRWSFVRVSPAEKVSLQDPSLR